MLSGRFSNGKHFFIFQPSGSLDKLKHIYMPANKEIKKNTRIRVVFTFRLRLISVWSTRTIIKRTMRSFAWLLDFHHINFLFSQEISYQKTFSATDEYFDSSVVTFTTAVLKLHSREKFNIKYIIINFLVICNFLEQGQLAWEYIAPTVPRYLSEKYFY